MATAGAEGLQNRIRQKGLAALNRHCGLREMWIDMAFGRRRNRTAIAENES